MPDTGPTASQTSPRRTPELARLVARATRPDGTMDVDALLDLVDATLRDLGSAVAALDEEIDALETRKAELHDRVLSDARKTLMRFVVNSRDALIALDVAGSIVLMNRPAAALLDVADPRAMFMRPVTDVLPPEVLGEGVVEFEIERPDGTRVPVSSTHNEGAINGDVFRIVGLRDESEARGREAALEAARRAAVDANEAKSNFLAMMSHELRTPLNALVGSADLLARTELSALQASYVRMFNEAGHLMTALVNDVLDYAKIEAGRLEIERQPTSLVDLAREIEEMWAAPAARKNVAFALDARGLDVDGVLADPTRLRQIAFNLVSNAVKFTARGEVRVTVSATPRDGEVDVTIRVEDTGIGIPEDRLDGVFRAFVQADSSITRRYGGTGLGLSIARSLALQMGGDLVARSVEGAGSTFTLMLRLPPATLDGRADGEAGVDGAPPPLRILAVDDNELNRRMLAALLDLWPVSAAWATDGAEALDLLSKEAFDLVLMDIQMPVMDGITATRRLRARPGPNRHVPVIALTANVRPEDRAACTEAGMTGFVGKPIVAELLMSAIVEAVAPTLDDERAPERDVG